MTFPSARVGSKFALVAVMGLALAAVGCGSKKPPEPPPEPPVDAGAPEPPPEPPAPKSLFERLGGKEGIAALVDTLMENVQADKRINKVFAKTKGDRMVKFKGQLVDQLCQLTGGPCEYKGKEMKPAHKGMAITDPQWDAFVEALTTAMQEKNVGQDEQGEVMAALAKFHDDVVEKKGK
jgi:hemoglobin